MGVGLTVLGVGFTFGVKERIDEVLLLVPVAFFAVVLYGISNMTVILLLNGYKEYLEDRINDACGQKLVFWSAISRPMVIKSPVILGLNFVYLFLLAATVVIGLRTAWSVYPLPFSAAFSILLLSLTVVLGVSLVRMVGAPQRAYNVAWKEAGRDDGAAS